MSVTPEPKVPSITDPMMNLKDLLQKTPDANVLREMIGFAAERVIELEVDGLMGAGFGEKNPERLVQRNGYRDRDWETRAGRSNCAYRSCAKVRTFPGSWSRGALPRRH